jgi:protein-tyrosine kinase
MGRVEDAIRRAAEQEAAGAPAVLTDDGAGVPAEVLFPVEFPADEPAAVSVRSSTPEPARSITPVDVSAAASHGAKLIDIVDRRLKGKVVADIDMPASSREQYRRLAATLYHTQVAGGLKVVMIASAVAGEGKTLTAANLALTLSESYRRNVLLIDGDLRRPSLHTVFRMESTPGLSDGLIAEHTKMPLHRLTEHLTLLTAGRPTSDPMAALISSRMQRLIREARETFEWIIIDTPPVGLMTDANLMAAMADGAIVVVKAGSTPYHLVHRAVDALGRDRLLGVVLNRTTLGPEGGKYYSNYYGQYYGAKPMTK